MFSDGSHTTAKAKFDAHREKRDAVIVGHEAVLDIGMHRCGFFFCGVAYWPRPIVLLGRTRRCRSAWRGPFICFLCSLALFAFFAFFAFGVVF
jgi:hypothetical protein